jgi:NAD+-dependent secondary alcohol dehydrogenase Adh1
MRAALLSTYHRPLELVERPEPEPQGYRDVVVRIAGAGVCSTDVHAIEGLMEVAGLRPPIVLGHENAGYVHAVGDGVTAASVGDPVLIYPPYSCGLCIPCRRGFDMHCEHHQFTGLTRDGGFADFVLVDERSLVLLPAGVDPIAVAPHADAGITASHAVKKLLPDLVPGGTAVLIGVGGVGHIALQLVRVLSGSKVIAVDTDERRRKLAGELGADEVLEGGGNVADAVREATDGAGADVVIDFVGNDATHEAGIAMLARRGVYAIVGYGGTVTCPSPVLVSRETTIMASLVGSWIDLWDVVQLQASGRLTLKTETHPLEDVNEVLAKLRDGDVTGRAVLVP